jgi:hypothetical protein
MNFNRKTLIVAALCLLTGIGAFAATSSAAHSVQLNVPEIVMMSLNSVATVTLSVQAPAAGGLAPVGQTDNSKYLWYTTVNAAGTNRNISVQWGGADVAPAGTSLHVQATSVTGGCGTAGAAVTIGAGAQNIVTAIPSCVTGQAANGAQLTYTLQVDTVASLAVGDNHLVTVTFTLTDAS